MTQVVLGDQSPWLGGLLRARALAALRSDLEVVYFLADGDSPWVNAGSGSVGFRPGWPSYASLGVRNPWGRDVPTISFPSQFFDSLGLPSGSLWLGGCGTHATLASNQAAAQVTPLLQQALRGELAWTKTLGSLLGSQVRELEELEWPLGSRTETPLTIARSLALLCEAPEVQSFLALFRETGCRLKEDALLPDEYFWQIDREGNRSQVDRRHMGIVTPRGEALPLEYARRGWMLGCTSLPYWDRVVALRDRYYPELPLKVLKIGFDWNLPISPSQALVKEYHRKKTDRAVRTGGSYGGLLPEGTLEAAAAIDVYWRSRPSVITWLALGGELNSTFREEVY